MWPEVPHLDGPAWDARYLSPSTTHNPYSEGLIQAKGITNGKYLLAHLLSTEGCTQNHGLSRSDEDESLQGSAHKQP
jgi:hypothetical protein